MDKRYVIMIELGVDGQLRWLHAEEEEIQYNDAQARTARRLHRSYKQIQTLQFVEQVAREAEDSAGRIRALRMEQTG